MVKAKMNYNIEDMKAYCKHIRGSKGILAFYTVLFAAYTAGLIVFVLSGIETYALITMGAVQVVIASLFVFMVYTVKSAPQRELNRIIKKYNGTEIEYIFSEDGFSTASEKSESTVTLKYKKLEYIVETEDYFFLAHRETNDFAIRKSSITDGTAEQLAEMIKADFKGDYKVK